MHNMYNNVKLLGADTVCSVIQSIDVPFVVIHPSSKYEMFFNKSSQLIKCFHYLKLVTKSLYTVNKIRSYFPYH